MRTVPILSCKSRPVRLLLSLAVGSLLVIATAVVWWPAVRVGGHLRAARRALEQGDIPAALQSLAVAERIAPDRAEVQYLLAAGNRREGRLDQFDVHLLRAAELGWSDADVQRQQWLARAQKGDVEAAERPLMEIIDRGASDAVAEEIYEALAKGQLASFRLRDAWKYLDLWLHWRPDAPQARMLRADIYERMGELPSAVDDYRAVLKQLPEHPKAIVKLGQILLRRNQTQEARQQFRTRLATVPDDADALLGMAQCESRLGALDEARHYLEAAFRQDLTPPQRAQGLMEQGRLLLGEGNAGEAVDALMQAVRFAPAESSVHYALARALTAAGERGLAQHHADRVRQIKAEFERMTKITGRVIDSPHDADLRYEAGAILIGQGLKSEALGWLSSALKCDPNHQRTRHLLAAEGHFQAGLDAFAKGDLDALQAAAEALRGVQPYDPHRSLLQGMVLLRTGRLWDVIHEFGGAKDHPDTRVLACALSGEVLYKAQQFRDAEGILTTALKLDPSQTDARRWLAATYHDIGAMNDALKQLAVIAEQAPADPRPHRLMGLIHKDFEAYAKAIDEYRESLKRDPDQPDEQTILVELAECLLHERRHAEAQETLGRCLRSERVLTLQAQCRYAQGDAAGARKLVDEALELEPKRLEAMQIRATLDLEANDAESALRILRRAVLDYPNDFRLRYQLAQAYQRLGRPEPAREQLETMQELRKLRLRFTELHKQAITEPANAETRYQLGVVARQLDEPQLAQSWFTAALGMDPEHAGARQSLQAMSGQSPSPPKDGLDDSALKRSGT